MPTASLLSTGAGAGGEPVPAASRSPPLALGCPAGQPLAAKSRSEDPLDG